MGLSAGEDGCNGACNVERAHENERGAVQRRHTEAVWRKGRLLKLHFDFLRTNRSYKTKWCCLGPFIEITT
jgi:hypothetical protein